MKKRGFIVRSIAGVSTVVVFSVHIVSSFAASDASKPYNKLLVHAMAAEALGKIGDARASDFLLNALDSKEHFVRAYAAQALGELGNQNAIAVLRKLKNDSNYLVRIYSAVSLIKLKDTDADKTLLGFLQDNDPAVKATAVYEMGELGSKFGTEVFDVSRNDKDPIVRSKALAHLDKISLPLSVMPIIPVETKLAPIIASLREALDDPDWHNRQAACEGLGKLMDKKSISFLIERLGDTNSFVRSSAKEALSLLGERSLIKLFWSDLKDSDPVLVTSSFIALANLHDETVIPVLLKNLVSPQSSLEVRVKAARALAILKPYVGQLVNNGLVITNLNKVFSADTTLGVTYQIDGKDITDIFVEALQDAKNPLYYDAPLVIKEFHDTATSPALREALASGDADMVATVIYVLGELRDTNAVDKIIAACKRF